MRFPLIRLIIGALPFVPLIPSIAEEPSRLPGASVPFVTIEAESSENRVVGQVVRMAGRPTRTSMTPELEASGRAFVELKKTGDLLEIAVSKPADGLVLRHCIPDVRGGGGQTATLSLLVNGELRQRLTLSSRSNWLYGEAGQNGQSDSPADGSPHVFWNETRFRIERGLKAGDRLQLRKGEDDRAEFYRIDLADLEAVPEPLSPPRPGTSLSVAEFGADGGDTKDDAAAIQACIDAAKTQRKTVWLPPGTYYQSAKFRVDGVTVQGAGMWHTAIIGNVDESTAGFAGKFGFALSGDGAAVSDLFLESRMHSSRRSNGGRAFTAAYGNCDRWRVENVWITHAHGGFWMSGCSNGLVRNCRVRFTYADGINLNRGSQNCTVENCHIRGCGDDGIAVLSEQERTPRPSVNQTLRSNTVSAIWWGHNLDIAGGSGHLVENNLLADNPLFGVLTINMPGAYPMYPLTGAVFRGNRLERGGGNYVGQKRGAFWIYADTSPVSGVQVIDNEIIAPVFRGIHLAGDMPQEITFERNRISRPGEAGIVVGSSVKGTGRFIGNEVQNLNPGIAAFVNQSRDFRVTGQNNSWPVK